MFIIDDDPKIIIEAMDSKVENSGKKIMVEEMATLYKNEAWDLVHFSVGRNPIGSKWVFMKKSNAQGRLEKYKAK